VILGIAVLMPGSDGQTDGQTPRPWLRCAKHSAIARKKYIACTSTIIIIALTTTAAARINSV